MNRLSIALVCYVVLGALAWTTLTDPRIRAATLVVLALFLALVSRPSLAIPQEYNPGYELPTKQDHSLYSSVLREKRSIEVIVPADFKKDSPAKYDVIYVLDGIRAYHYVAYDYLRGEGFLPKNVIVVGLLGAKDTPTRFRDFTPLPTSSTWPSASCPSTSFVSPGGGAPSRKAANARSVPQTPTSCTS